MKNTILIILNSRLKTLDTILPLMMELNTNQVEIIYYSPDELTTKSIKNNIVIYDCLKNSGKLLYFNKVDYRFLNKFKKIFFFFKLAIYAFFKLLFNKIDLIYFSELKGKKKFLKYFKYNVFLCENDPYGHTKHIEWTKKLEREKLLGIKINSSSFFLPKQNMIIFTKDFYNLKKNINNPDVNFWPYSDLKLSKNWYNYIIENKERYFRHEFEINKLKMYEKIITISLGIFNKDFGWDKTGKIMEELLDETLDSILDLKLNLPVFLKPYPITSKGKDLEYLKILNNILKSKKYDKFIISYLHPMILAQKSIFMIANSNTANFADFKYFGVPTIEYTHYSDLLLKSTNYKSIRPDWATYFINHDKKKLIYVLQKILKENKKEKIQKFQLDNINDQLIWRLNGNKKVKIKTFNEISTFLK